MTPAICTDPSQMEAVRTLLLLGIFFMGILAVAINYTPKPKKPKTTTYCPLHRTDRDECADKHKD